MAKQNLPFHGMTSDSLVVELNEITLGHLTQIAGWADFDGFATSVLEQWKLPLPRDFRLPTRAGDLTAFRIAPDRILLRSAEPLSVAGNPQLTTLDLSDARIAITITGEGAVGLLARSISVDLGIHAFPVGSFVQTGMHHVGVLILREAIDQFLVLMPTTWAASLLGFLMDHLTPT